MDTKSNNKWTAMLVWFCITMFYCYQYVLRVLPNIIMPDIMAKFGIGATEFGSFAGIYYMGYIIVHIPVGLLITHLGARTVIPVCIALTAIGLAPLTYMDSWNGAVIGRVVTGVGSSAAIVGALQIFRILYSGHFTKMVGIMASLGLITIVYSGTPIAKAIEILGINATINILIYAGIALAIATYILMPKSTEEVLDGNIFSDLKTIFGNYKLLLVCICSGLMVGPLEGFADAWGGSFLTNVYGIEKLMADNISLSVFLGMCGGCIILPYIVDKTRLYYSITVVSGLIMVACFIHILSGNATETTLYYACIIVGIFSAYQIVIIAKVVTFVSEERSGIAAATANMIVMAFGTVFHYAIGSTLDSSWSGEMVDGVKVYDSAAFIKSMSVIPIGITVAVIGIMIVGVSELIRAEAIKKA